MKKLIAALLCAVLVLSVAQAEEMHAQGQLIAPMPDAETSAQIVEGLFAAATGTDFEEEKAVRRKMSEEEHALRSEENALYRAQTLPWLKECLSMGSVFEQREKETKKEDNSPEPEWTTEDAWAAMQTNAKGQAYLELLAGHDAQEMESALKLTQDAVSVWVGGIDHEELREMNGDYAFWLYGPGTQIDYPVVQGQDNALYLNRLFNGRRNSAGTLFVDSRNLPEMQDPNTLVYGHHMRNDSMFGSLTDYEEKGYFDAHPYFLAVSEGEICLMEVFAGYTTSDRDHCYDIAISDDEDLKAFVEEAKAKSDFETDVEIIPGDRLMTLSTCAYAFRDARYIAISRLVPLWTRPETEMFQ